MGGCRCSYKNCANTTKTRDNLHFFHYPVKQKDRCRTWIENAEKPQFYDLDEDQLRNKVICETHFENCYFPNIQKKRLLQGAIPTLQGDCERVLPVTNRRPIKIQDVNILPTNAEGTIFVLETNMQTHFQSEKVESYIYTNNGLVLPISKCAEIEDDNIETIYSETVSEEPKVKNDSEVSTAVLTNSYENLINEKEVENYMFVDNVYNEEQVNSNESVIEINPTQSMNQTKQTEPVETETIDLENSVNYDLISKTLSNKYVKKIKQHSRDIAILKRMLKSKNVSRKPTNSVILNTLKRQISSSLYSVVNLNINSSKAEVTAEDLEFYTTIFSKSPELYQILIEKYHWKLPSPETLDNFNSNQKNNGHV